MSKTQQYDQVDPVQACFIRLAAAELGSSTWEAACHDLVSAEHIDIWLLFAGLGTADRSLRAGVARTLKVLGAVAYYGLILRPD